MVYKIVGGASGIFNDIAVFVGVLHTAQSLQVSAHLHKPVGNSLYKERKFMGFFWTGWLTALWMGYISPAIWLAGTLSQHGLWLHAWGSWHVSELQLILRPCSATIYCCWQPAGIFVSPPRAVQTSHGYLRAAECLLHPFWQGGKLPDAVLSPLAKAVNVLINHIKTCFLHGVQYTAPSLKWPCAVSQMPVDPWNARAGGQHPRSAKALYPPWKDSTGADKSDTSSLTFLTATTFEAFSCHPRWRCCCRGCRSAPRSGDRPRTAAAAASAPCPCERGHS